MDRSGSRRLTPPAEVSSTPRLPGHLPSLDGLRAVGALMIASTHLIPGLRAHGLLGVSIFLPLSGFLITSMLLADSGLSMARFVDRRVRRLAPAALLMTLGVVVISFRLPRVWPVEGMFGDAVSVFTNTANWRFLAEGQANPIRFLAPLEIHWTLAIEEQFYLIVPLLVWASARTRAPRRTLAVALVVVYAASVAALLIERGYRSELLHTETRLLEPVAGCLLALALPGWDTSILRVRGRSIAPLLGVGGAIGVGCLWWLWRTTSSWPMDWGLPLVSVACIALLVGALSPGPVARVLGWGPLAAVGRVSYGIYLYHWPVLLVVKDDWFGGDLRWVVGTRIAVTAAVATASYLLVEQPVRSRRVLPGRSFYAVWGTGVATTLVLAWLLGR